MKKNNDTKNELLATMKKAVKLNFDALELKNSIERNLDQHPVLTEAELEELNEKADVFASEMADKGCWIGLGSFRVAGKEDQTLLVQASGSVSMLALMVAEAMNCKPWLEQVLLLGVAMKLKFGDMADTTEDNEDEDYNEEEE